MVDKMVSLKQTESTDSDRVFSFSALMLAFSKVTSSGFLWPYLRRRYSFPGAVSYAIFSSRLRLFSSSPRGASKSIPTSTAHRGPRSLVFGILTTNFETFLSAVSCTHTYLRFLDCRRCWFPSCSGWVAPSYAVIVTLQLHLSDSILTFHIK